MDLEQILHRAKLRAVLLRYTRDHHLVEDLCQNTLIKCWQYVSRNGVDPPSRFVRVVGVRELCSSMRKRRPQTLPANYDGPSAAGSPAESLERAERSSLVLAAITTLPQRYQLPAKLHFIEGLPYAAIAEHIGRREGTVKAWLHRAKRLLCRQLQVHFGN